MAAGCLQLNEASDKNGKLQARVAVLEEEVRKTQADNNALRLVAKEAISGYRSQQQVAQDAISGFTSQLQTALQQVRTSPAVSAVLHLKWTISCPWCTCTAYRASERLLRAA